MSAFDSYISSALLWRVGIARGDGCQTSACDLTNCSDLVQTLPHLVQDQNTVSFVQGQSTVRQITSKSLIYTKTTNSGALLFMVESSQRQNLHLSHLTMSMVTEKK